MARRTRARGARTSARARASDSREAREKAVSPLVATVIILAITVAAGIVLYSIVWPLINKPIQQTKCTEITFELDELASCVRDVDGDGISDEIDISVDRTRSKSNEPDIAAWRVIFDNGQGRRISGEFDSTLDADWEISPGEQKTPVVALSPTTISL